MKYQLKEVMTKDDMDKIAYAVFNNPLGSYQMGEIARISGELQTHGIDVLAQLKLVRRKYRIDSQNIKGDDKSENS